MQLGPCAVSAQAPWFEQLASAGLTQVVPQSAEPEAQPQAYPLKKSPRHAAVLPAAAGQGAHRVPQELTLSLGRHRSPQRWKPGLHEKSQAVPLQTGEAFAGVVQAAQVAPHFKKPGLHAKAHAPLVQTPTPFAGGLQVVQTPPQRKKPGSHVTPQLEALLQTGWALA